MGNERSESTTTEHVLGSTVRRRNLRMWEALCNWESKAGVLEEQLALTEC